MMAQLFVLDRHETPVAVLSTEAPGACPFFDDLHTERLEDGFATYEFSVPLDHEDAAKIEARGYVLFRDLDGFFQLFRIETIDDTLSNEGERIRKVYAETAATELNNDIVRPVTVTGTAEEALDMVLAGTRWQKGEVQWTGSITLELRDYPTVLAAIQRIREAFGGELRFRVEYDNGQIVARYVDLLQRRGQVTGKRFEYRKDLAGATRTEDTTRLVTAMIGLGKGDDQGNRLTFTDVTWSKANGDPVDKPRGQDWVGDPDALQIWGVGGQHVFGVYDDNDEEDPARLLQKTWDELQNRIHGRFMYEVDVAVLERLAGFEHEAVRLGDTVTVHDYVHEQPFILEARVIEMQRSYTDPSKDKVVLGRYRPILFSLPEVVANLQDTIRRKQAQWEAGGGETIYKSPLPPQNPMNNQLWLDTSVTPNVLKRYDAQTGQWVKATPTQASEVGAETPEGAQQKANAAEQNAKTYAQQQALQAEQNAKTYTDQVAERKITRSPTPPSNPATDAIWIDTSVSPPVWKRWNGSEWEKMTRTDFAELYGKITGQQIAPDAIEPQHIAWLDASLITTGTMLADRIRGGTLELGGASGGVLSLKDGSGVERVRGDSTGLTVTDANFFVRDAQSQVSSIIRPVANMVNDHSFELVPIIGSMYSDQTFDIDTQHPHYGNSFWWMWFGSGPHRVVSTYQTDLDPIALFDHQAAVVGDTSGLVQFTRLDSVAKDQGPYTLSAYVSTWDGTSVDGVARMELHACDENFDILATYYVTTPLYRSQPYNWKRLVLTVPRGYLPPGTTYLEIVFTTPTVGFRYLVDGVQLVPFDRPTVYDPESSIWRHLQDVYGHASISLSVHKNLYVYGRDEFGPALTNIDGRGVTTYGQLSAPLQPFVWAYQSTQQTIPASTNTKVNFQAKMEDRRGNWDTTLSRFFLRNYDDAGIYLVNAAIQFANLLTSGYLFAYKNGSFYARMDHGSNIITLAGSTLVPMSYGDYLDIRVNVNPQMAITTGSGNAYVKILKVC